MDDWLPSGKEDSCRKSKLRPTGHVKNIESFHINRRQFMNTFFKIITWAFAFMLAVFVSPLLAQDAQPAASQDSTASFQNFYDQLAGQGTWIQTDQYGYVFQPTETDPNWRPYMYGHWVNTEAGLTWVSDDPFGWATDHYGRWVNLDGYGWVWVPGYTWAPAWVSWREGDDEVGWAPLPPDSDQGIDYYDDDNYFTDDAFDLGFHIGDDCDLAYGIGPWCYNFCPVAFIGDRDAWRHFRDPRDNFGFIGRTRNVTNLNFRRDEAGRFGRVHSSGPSVAALNERARTPITTARLNAAAGLRDAGLQGNSLAVYAPRIDPNTSRTARPASISRNLGNVAVNRGTDINRPLMVNSRIGPARATSEQARAAALAEANAPAGARIATGNTRISRPLTRPLTSLHTGTRSMATVGFGNHSNTFARSRTYSTPSVSAGSRYTGQAVAPRSTFSSSEESRYTGEGAAGSSFHSSSVYRSNSSYFTGTPANVYHPNTPVFRSSTPAYYSGGSAFHTSMPAYHPQASFHSFAPSSQPHFGLGGSSFHTSAPAAHFSGGGGGHVATGGGQASVGGRR